MRIVFLYDLGMNYDVDDVATQVWDFFPETQVFCLIAEREHVPAPETHFRRTTGKKEGSIDFLVEKVEEFSPEGYTEISLRCVGHDCLSIETLVQDLKQNWFQWEEIEDWAEGRSDQMPTKL